MKIAVDMQSTRGNKTGIGVATQHLVDAMKAAAPDVQFLEYASARNELNTFQRLLWENAQIPLKVLREKPDVVYSPGFAPAWACASPALATVHDLIGLAYPGNQGTISSFYWSSWLPRAIRRADRIVASSEHTRRDIERFLKISPSQVEVVPLGANPLFGRLDDNGGVESVLSELNLRQPFFICVGTLETRKNHLGLLRAYQWLKQRGKNKFSLVFVGKAGTGYEKVASFIQENGLGPYVRIMGYLPDEKLNCLYNAAAGYVMISFYEGFGLPVLEAMSCGLPGVISNNTSLPEVAGDTALSVRPDDVEGTAEALYHISENASFRADMGARAALRSKNFSMHKAASRMIGICKEMARRRASRNT